MKVIGISQSYKEMNEDRYGQSKYACWVMDGASSLNKRNFTTLGNDVVWLVQWWQKYLTDHLDHLHEELRDILQKGVEAYNQSFSQFTAVQNLSKLDQASAGIAIARVRQDKLECFVLGDVELHIQLKSGKVDTLTDDRIKILDDQVITLMNNDLSRTERTVFKDFTQEELTLLQINRMKMNSAEGYPILAHSSEAIGKGIYKEYSLADIYATLLMTDGYAILYNRYTRAELMAACAQRGIDRLLAEVRDLELQDPLMRKYPRLKLHDDATAVWVTY